MGSVGIIGCKFKLKDWLEDGENGKIILMMSFK